MKIIKSNRTLVIYGVNECQPCKQLLKTVNKANIDGLNVIKRNLNEYVEKANEHDISSLPFSVLKDTEGAVIDKLVGNVSVEQFREFVGQEA